MYLSQQPCVVIPSKSPLSRSVWDEISRLFCISHTLTHVHICSKWKKKTFGRLFPSAMRAHIFDSRRLILISFEFFTQMRCFACWFIFYFFLFHLFLNFSLTYLLCRSTIFLSLFSASKYSLSVFAHVLLSLLSCFTTRLHCSFFSLAYD